MKRLLLAVAFSVLVLLSATPVSAGTATLTATPSAAWQNEPVVLSGCGYDPAVRVDLALSAWSLLFTTSAPTQADGCFTYTFYATGTWGTWRAETSQYGVTLAKTTFRVKNHQAT